MNDARNVRLALTTSYATVRGYWAISTTIGTFPYRRFRARDSRLAEEHWRAQIIHSGV
jgi:hypothetical protein